jgi:hypothetical protein
MGRASNAKQNSSRRDRIAAQREAARRDERRNRLLIAGGAVIVVVAVVAAILIVNLNSKGTSASAGSGGPTGTSLSAVVKTVTSVPTSASDSVGSGSGQVTAKPQTIPGTLLTANGKPEMVYMGGEYCPYCAAERWSMIVALSRFGTFSGLKTIRSSTKNGAGESEPYGNTPTWTFDGSTYTSSYLAFSPVEMFTNVPDASTGEYTALQTPTSAQNALINKWDAPPYVPSGDNGAFPFVDFGNKYMIAGASYSPQILSGLTWAQIANDLSTPSSTVAQGIDGTANYITAAICKLTNNLPASACTSAVQSLQSSI